MCIKNEAFARRQESWGNFGDPHRYGSIILLSQQIGYFGGPWDFWGKGCLLRRKISGLSQGGGRLKNKWASFGTVKGRQVG